MLYQMLNNKRNKSKHKGIKGILYNFVYSYQGLKYAYLNEKSMWIHVVLSSITIILGIFLNIRPIEWLIIILVLGAILSIELLNTAIEAVVDMITTKYNELAKIAKDCGSAATFIATLIGFITILSIYIPKIVILINN